MLQRVRQFREASSLPTDGDLALAREHLPPALAGLFEGQHQRDVLHAARTARWLLERGHGDSDLVAAALLHDIGKGSQRRRDRVAYVVSGWFGTARFVASAGSRFELRRAVARSRTHSEVGAEMLLSAGAPARVVELVRMHHAKAAGDAMLGLLQQADAAS